MENPLFVKGDLIYYDSYQNEMVKVDILNINKLFKSVYILCPFTSIEDEVIFNNIIDKDLFNKIIDKMILYKTNISIVKNNIHFGNLILCPSHYIARANKFEYELNEEVLILPIYNISFLSIQKYIDNMNGLINFNTFYEIMIVNNYFGDNINSEFNKIKINTLLSNLEESHYWAMSYNCLPNITKIFDKRQFNFNILKIDNNNKNIIERMGKSPIQENYLTQIFNSRNYVDPSEIINKKGYKLYWKVINCDYNKIPKQES